MIGVASLVGGVLGVYLRNMVDTDERFSRSAFIGALGALLMGVGIGYMFAEPQAPGDPPVLGVGLSSAMLTYCVFTPATVKAFRIRGSRTVLTAVALGIVAVVAGSLGAAVGALVV